MLQRQFERATQTTGDVSVSSYRIAGEVVQLEFAGAALAERIAGAFAHLRLPAGETEHAALVVRLWDSASSGIEPPPFADALPETTDGTGPIRYHEDAGFRALVRWRTMSAYDARGRLAWFWAPSADAMLSWDWASPLRSILHWWLGDRGMLQVHAGAVGLADGGVLLVGQGGSGKSTSTLACLASELRYVGDDFVAIDPEALVIHSLYSSGKLDPRHAERFPHLESAVVDVERAEDEKLVFHVHGHFPHATCAGFPLRAVVVPRLAGGTETRTVRLGRGAALAALAPSTLFQLHPPQPDALRTMSDVVRRVPAYSLELGTDVAAIPAALVGLLEELR